MDVISLAISYQRDTKRNKKIYAMHRKRNQAINMCKRIGLHWKANDHKIKIVEWNETFTHSQTDELIRRLNSLDAY